MHDLKSDAHKRRYVIPPPPLILAKKHVHAPVLPMVPQSG